MPTPTLDEPTTKITLNIYTADYKEVKRIYGQGWSTRLREMVRDHLRIRRGVAHISLERKEEL
jgi:hypothetical protein